MSKKSKFNARGVGISKHDMDEYDEDNMPRRKEQNRRRPVRNWKKAWDHHQTDYDDHDEFFGK